LFRKKTLDYGLASRAYEASYANGYRESGVIRNEGGNRRKHEKATTKIPDKTKRKRCKEEEKSVKDKKAIPDNSESKSKIEIVIPDNSGARTISVSMLL
jgi:hypothetical protein